MFLDYDDKLIHALIIIQAQIQRGGGELLKGGKVKICAPAGVLYFIYVDCDGD